MVRGVRSAAQVEQLLRKAARRAGNDWTVKEVPGKDGRKRGKGSRQLVGLYDENGVKLAWTTIPQHPGDLARRWSEKSKQPSSRIWERDGWINEAEVRSKGLAGRRLVARQSGKRY
jgi:hypothetical protein